MVALAEAKLKAATQAVGVSIYLAVLLTEVVTA
jgi:hypothetical protein